MSGISSTGIPLKDCTVQTCPIDEAHIHYLPSMAGNIIYIICFISILMAQSFMGIRYRTWSFFGAMLPGLILEITGYIGRVMLHNNPFVFNSFLIYLVCLTIGPAFFSACIYLCLSRIVTVVGPQHSRLKGRTYTKIFVCCDILALLLQAAGGAMASSAKDHKGSQLGTNVMIAGLVWQVLSLTLFLALWGDFMLRVKKARKMGVYGGGLDSNYATLRESKLFQMFQISLLVATFLIYIRSVYRVIELAGGFSGEIANNEALFMIFEGPMIIIAVLGLTVWHPGRVFHGLWSETKGKQSKKGNKDIEIVKSGAAVNMYPLNSSSSSSQDRTFEQRHGRA